MCISVFSEEIENGVKSVQWMVFCNEKVYENAFLTMVKII